MKRVIRVRAHLRNGGMIRPHFRFVVYSKSRYPGSSWLIERGYGERVYAEDAKTAIERGGREAKIEEE